MVVKLVELGEYGRQHYQLVGAECIIGREPSCDLRSDHGQVSNRHTRIFRAGKKLMVEDLNSATHTFINGDRVSAPTELSDGDELYVGPVHFLVMIGEDEAELAARSDSWIAEVLGRRRGGKEEAFDPRTAVSAAMQTAQKILHHLHDQESGSHPSEEEEEAAAQGLEIADEGGIALARILDRSLIDETDIRRFAHELNELIKSGRNRIALHFGEVEQCSSQALSTVLRASRHCEASGGALKICTPTPAVAELFEMINLGKSIEIFPKSESALDSVWPTTEPDPEPGDQLDAISAVLATEMPVVRLKVESGKSEGKIIQVKGRRFVIGRDSRCNLRPNSETVSRIHAIIERHEGKVTVRDYGTRNGTILAGRVLRGEEAEASDGDSLQVGVLRFSMQVLPMATAPTETMETDLADWLLEQSKTDENAPTSLMIPTPKSGSESPFAESEVGALDPESEEGEKNDLKTDSLECEIIREVLVVRIRKPSLEDESTVGPLRYELQNFFDKPLPRRVVLNLENVNFLSSRAVGVILAFFQHLDREHGALRVCCVSPKILGVLDSMRLPDLMDLYPTAEEAVNDPWI